MLFCCFVFAILRFLYIYFSPEFRGAFSITCFSFRGDFRSLLRLSEGLFLLSLGVFEGGSEVDARGTRFACFGQHRSMTTFHSRRTFLSSADW